MFQLGEGFNQTEYDRGRVLVWRAGLWDGARWSDEERNCVWGKGAILRLRIGMACHDALFLGRCGGGCWHIKKLKASQWTQMAQTETSRLLKLQMLCTPSTPSTPSIFSIFSLKCTFFCIARLQTEISASQVEPMFDQARLSPNQWPERW